MSGPFVILLVALLATTAFYVGRGRARSVASGDASSLHSLPSYHGVYVAMWAAIPALLVLMAWLIIGPQLAEWYLISALPDSQVAGMTQAQLNLLVTDVKNLATGNISSRTPDPVLVEAAAGYANALTLSNAAMVTVVLSLTVLGAAMGRRHVALALRARNQVERVFLWIMIAASSIAILTTIGIVASLVFEAARFFARVPWYEFLFGLQWSPQTALRAEQIGASGSFGAVPIFAGTFLITLIAMVVAVPIGLFSAIYMSEYASPRLRGIAKPALEVLAGVPTVVYGFFAALTVAPMFRGFGEGIGLDVSSESALAAGMVMGIMIIPFVSSLSDDVMNAVPQTLRDGAYALGATKSETIKQVILPAALPGIVGAVLLAVSRAIGETMIVVMAAGLAANLTANPLEAVTTVTVQIVTLLVGDQEFDSAKTLAAFALGLVLFVITLCLNVFALNIVRKYREKYD